MDSSDLLGLLLGLDLSKIISTFRRVVRQIEERVIQRRHSILEVSTFVDRLL